MNRNQRLPIKYPLLFIYLFSILIALLTTITSLGGIFYSSIIYPDEQLAQNFLTTDVLNLILGLPVLLLSMLLTLRGKTFGLLFWPGSIMFLLYHFIAYVFGMPLSWVFLIYLVILVMSVYTLIGLVAVIDGEKVKQILTGKMSIQFSGWVLFIFGMLFSLKVVGDISNDLLGIKNLAVNEFPVLMADFILCPAWFIGGFLMIKKKTFGYTVGTGLLLQGTMLFLGLMIYFILNPILTGADFLLSDLIVISIMGLVFFIPFILNIIGIIKR
ncbi:MAG: hypothetical protein MJB14_13590 [Spirochaetes bacterium]|nr:hypothetical protein [Spirochaetota bacterium]